MHNISVVLPMQGYSKERAYIAAQGEYKPCPADFLKWLFLVYRSHGHFSCGLLEDDLGVQDAHCSHAHQMLRGKGTNMRIPKVNNFQVIQMTFTLYRKSVSSTGLLVWRRLRTWETASPFE